MNNIIDNAHCFERVDDVVAQIWGTAKVGGRGESMGEAHDQILSCMIRIALVFMKTLNTNRDGGNRGRKGRESVREKKRDFEGFGRA